MKPSGCLFWAFGSNTEKIHVAAMPLTAYFHLSYFSFIKVSKCKSDITTNWYQVGLSIKSKTTSSCLTTFVNNVSFLKYFSLSLRIYRTIFLLQWIQ